MVPWEANTRKKAGGERGGCCHEKAWKPLGGAANLGASELSQGREAERQQAGGWLGSEVAPAWGQNRGRSVAGCYQRRSRSLRRVRQQRNQRAQATEVSPHLVPGTAFGTPPAPHQALAWPWACMVSASLPRGRRLTGPSGHGVHHCAYPSVVDTMGPHPKRLSAGRPRRRQRRPSSASCAARTLRHEENSSAQPPGARHRRAGSHDGYGVAGCRSSGPGGPPRRHLRAPGGARERSRAGPRGGGAARAGGLCAGDRR